MFRGGWYAISCTSVGTPYSDVLAARPAATQQAVRCSVYLVYTPYLKKRQQRCLLCKATEGRLKERRPTLPSLLPLHFIRHYRTGGISSVFRRGEDYFVPWCGVFFLLQLVAGAFELLAFSVHQKQSNWCDL